MTPKLPLPDSDNEIHRICVTFKIIQHFSSVYFTKKSFIISLTFFSSFPFLKYFVDKISFTIYWHDLFHLWNKRIRYKGQVSFSDIPVFLPRYNSILFSFLYILFHTPSPIWPLNFIVDIQSIRDVHIRDKRTKGVNKYFLCSHHHQQHLPHTYICGYISILIR